MKYVCVTVWITSLFLAARVREGIFTCQVHVVLMAVWLTDEGRHLATDIYNYKIQHWHRKMCHDTNWNHNLWAGSWMNFYMNHYMTSSFIYSLVLKQDTTLLYSIPNIHLHITQTNVFICSVYSSALSIQNNISSGLPSFWNDHVKIPFYMYSMCSQGCAVSHEAVRWMFVAVYWH